MCDVEADHLSRDSMRLRWLLIAGQGVQETLKGSGKHMYTLRFETEQLAQEWRRGFELIAKVSGSLQLQCLCILTPLLQHALVVQQKIAAAKK